MKKKLRRLWRQMTADKKKFGIMVTCMAVGLLLWGRLIFIENVPRVATADPTQSGSSGETLASASADSAAILKPLPEVAVALSEDLTLDLFAFRYSRYKPVPSRDIGRDGVQSDGLADDEQVRSEQLLELARELQLQSVIQGSVPMAVINGRVLRVGDSIEGFEIASFGPRSAKVTREGKSFVLRMTNP